MKKHFKLVLSLLVLVALLVLPYFVFATSSSSPLSNLNTVATQGGYQQGASPQNLLPTVIGSIIQTALGLLGAIFIILIVIGGYIWMTASGNDQKMEKAKNYISRAIIGLIITFSAWAIWYFILQKIILKTG